jgi:glycosyltransferase involved in cell wall biosynthesis
MAKIGVIHHDLMNKGGGETVCMNVLEELQKEHEVTLITLVDPDIDELNDYFSTGVGAITIDRTELIDRAFKQLQSATGKQFYLLRCSVLNRITIGRIADFDLVASTINELDLKTKSVQYVHSPQFIPSQLPAGMRADFPFSGLHDGLCRRIAGFDPSHAMSESHLLANSEWTAELFKNIYGTKPQVLYPPVNVKEIAPLDKPWGERDNTFLIIGRIVPHKNVLKAVRIIDRLRDRGHEVHLRIIGPAADTEYRLEVERYASSRDSVRFEGEMSRQELLKAMSTSRYGLHCTKSERFGIVVAEMTAAGMLPFVPDFGGQTEIVNDIDPLTFETTNEAVSSIERVLTNDDLRDGIMSSLPEPRTTFGRDRFKRDIRATVSNVLETN